MRIFLLVVVIVLISCNQLASSSVTNLAEKKTDIPRLQRVWDEKYGVMCYFPLKHGTEIVVLEGMSCIQLEK